MAKIVLDTVTGGYDLSVINNNFDKIETELQNKVLYRNNPVGEPNTLETDVDANGKRIYNLPEPLLDSEPARLQDLQNAVAGAAANLITFTPYGHVAGNNVQAAVQELIDDTTNNGVALPAFLKDSNTIVVDNISALKAIDKIKFTKAQVLGYYTKGDGGGGVYWFDPSDTASADNGGTVIVATDGGRWKLIHNGAVAAEQFGARRDGVTDDSAKIQAALDAMKSRGAGDVRLSRGVYAIANTLTINASNVRLIGAGGDGNHDAGSGALPGTTLFWTSGAAGTMLSVGSPGGIAENYRTGMEVRSLVLDGNAVASVGVLFITQRYGVYDRIHALNVTNAAYRFACWTQGIDFAEPTDIQGCIFSRLTWRLIDLPAVQGAKGVLMDSTGSGNPSFNRFEYCGGTTYGAAAGSVGWWIANADNNVFEKCSAFRINMTGEGFRIMSSFADANLFVGVSAGGINGISIRGTASGYASNTTRNTFIALDNSNGTQPPTIDAGCAAAWTYDTGAGVFGGVKFIAVQDVAQYPTERQNVGTESLRVYNGSANHIVMTDGASRWGVNIDAAGDLRILRLAGTGVLNAGNGVDIKVGGLRWTFGTSAPVSGTWARGDFCQNSQPAVGQPKGWRCTVSGTPGTWVSEGNL